MNVEANVLSIKDLISAYDGKPVLNQLDLFMKKGEICCVIGEEGAGKSTLLKAITQQLASTGKISYNGIDLYKLTTPELTSNNIDFISQGGNILKGFTVKEHISLAMLTRSKVEKIIIWEEIEKMFPKLIKLEKQMAGRLSGGERMILSIACMHATGADFVIMDEPTAGLAPETCKVVEDYLLQMKNEMGKTILLLEHNYDFAFEITDSIVILKDGALSEKYLPDAFLQKDFIDVKLYETIV